MFRFIVDLGEKMSTFFSTELQNMYYKYFFYSQFKNKIKKIKISVDKKYKKEIKKFYKEYCRISPMWHLFYSSCNGIKSVQYIPENIYYSKIEPYMNRKEFSKAIDDKCYYPEMFAYTIKRPRVILRNINGFLMNFEFEIISLGQAFKLCQYADKIVIKPSIDGTGGNNILVFNMHKCTYEDFSKALDKYAKNYVVEEVIKQSDAMAYFNQSSVNTIRYITYFNENGAHLLSAVLRIGGIDSFTDNFSTGGFAVGISEDGYVKDCAYDKNFKKVLKHPSGVEFAGKFLPKYEEGKEAVKKMHRRFTHFRIISWDIAVDENDMINLIEFNFTPQGIDVHQINNGPLFGDFTKEVLEETFKKGRKN